jgi:surfactin synthase thioesterase subunit
MGKQRDRTLERWGIRLDAGGPARVRLLWFHHAGGTAGTVATSLLAAPAGWEVLVPEYPGRGARAGAMRLPSVEALASHFAGCLPRLDDGPPTIVFGHSMGALVALEYLRHLPEEARRAAAALFVSAVRSPRRFDAERRRSPSSDEQLVDRLLAIGGTPREVLEDPLLRELILANLRADLRAVDAYVYTPGEPLALPIVAFAGARDPIASPDDLRAWGAETEGTFELRLFGGGHFYHLEDPAGFAAGLREAVEAILGP